MIKWNMLKVLGNQINKNSPSLKPAPNSGFVDGCEYWTAKTVLSDDTDMKGSLEIVFHP